MKLKIATKYTVLVIGLVLVCATVFMAVMTLSTQDHARERLQERGARLAEDAARIELAGTAAGAHRALDLVFADPSVAYAAVLDAASMVVAERKKNSDSVVMDSVVTDIASIPVGGGTRIADIADIAGEDGAEFIEFVSPLNAVGPEAAAPGYVRVLIPQRVVNAHVWANVASFGWVVALTVLLAALLTFVLSRRMTEPLRVLHTAVDNLGVGSFNYQVEIFTGDEIEDLAKNFNKMADQLYRYRTDAENRKDNLEELIYERTVELTESNQKIRKVMRQAVEAKRAAEQASKAKSEFLATMSHEIRTPLNGVLGMAEILEHSRLDKVQREYLQIITQSGRVLLDLINQILDFSKIEAGKIELNYSDFNLRQFIEEIAQTFAERAHKKNLELVCRIPPDLSLMVNSDVTRLRQIVSNLVGNSVKFTDQGMVEISVDVLDRTAHKAKLRFGVRDTGIGIAADKLDHIFETFAQADSSTTRKYGGTGLGLAIVKQLLELLGGEITVSSEEGKGSVFACEVWMPAETFENKDLLHISEKITGIRTMVVDDLEVNREIVVHQLKVWGLKCDQAESADQCMARLREAHAAGEPYHMALLDYHMPDKDGFALAQEISADPLLRDTVLIMLSSVNSLMDRAELQKTGIQSYLTKPVRQSDLFDAIASLSRYVDTRAPGCEGADDYLSGEGSISANILLAEDNPVNQKVATAVFSWLGCMPKIVGNGELAVAERMAGTYDMIFMDCQMPELDGYEATRVIREWEKANPGAGRVPIVALTANAVEGDREKCLAAGMDDYLAKPFRAEEIRAKILAWSLSDTNPVQTSSGGTVDASVAGSIHALAAATSGTDATPDNVTSVSAQTTTSAPLNGSAAHGTQGNGNLRLDRSDQAVGMGELVDLSVLDGYLAIQSKGAPDLRVTLVQAFLADAPDCLSKVQKSLARGDNVGLYQAAHALKSSSANVGAVEVARLSKEIELKGKQEQIEGLAEQVGCLDTAYRETAALFTRTFEL